MRLGKLGIRRAIGTKRIIGTERISTPLRQVQIALAGVVAGVALTVTGSLASAAADEAAAPSQAAPAAQAEPVAPAAAPVPQATAQAVTHIVPLRKKSKTKGKASREKDTDGTEALDRFEADTVIKSKYQLDGQPLEVDPD